MAVPASPPPQEQAPQPASRVQLGQAQVVAEPPPVPPIPPMPLDEVPPLATPPLPTHPQPQGGQGVPAGQLGQAQPQVPCETQPASAPPVQVQAQGAQLWPGMQEGHWQVQVPPPPPLEQSHSIGGQALPAGQ